MREIPLFQEANALFIASLGWVVALSILASSDLSFAADVLPQPEPQFKGKTTVSAKDSIPDWPRQRMAPADAPNIVLILLDDIGFADTSTFGGMAQTPELDKLAAQGLRYTNFHNTGLCSPTRAALLTGRNHHRVGFGVAELAGGFPGYNFIWKRSTASTAEVLRRNGYSTAAFGKWHNTPHWEISPLGPFDRWPTGLGFDSFYGFMAGKDNHWEPSSLYRNTTAVEARATPEQGYHLTTDITDEAIHWLMVHESLAAEKPYFLYFATGAVHDPHHAPKEWVDKYRGRFDLGWDELRQEIFARQKQLGVIPSNAELTQRPDEIPAWASLSVDQKKLYARQMEVYAGFIAHTDYELGRLLRAVQEGPRGNNTLVLYIVGDNGGSGSRPNGRADGLTSVEGQLKRIEKLGSADVPSNHYSAGWAWLGSTPFQWWKAIASHFGGTRAPLILSWPSRIRDKKGLRAQFTHVNDVAATIYELTGIRFPSTVDGVKQQPLDGVSFARTISHPNEPSRHRTQYFETMGNRAIYHDGWVAAARHWVPLLRADPDYEITRDRWELYHVTNDPSQARDVATKYPRKLKELRELFEREAHSNDVYPLLSGFMGDAPSLTDNKREFIYYPGMPRIHRAAMPPLSRKSYRITAQAIIPEAGVQGVIVSYGGRENGFAFYVNGDRLVYEHNHLNGTREMIASEIELPPGKVVLTFEFIHEGASKSSVPYHPTVSSGMGRLFINGKVAGQKKLTVAFGGAAGYAASLGIGQAFGSPVSAFFRPPFKFIGTLEKVTVELW